ncbi:MAG: RNA polymerase sigma factor [Gammaproteobacteria bacterium]
MQAVSDEQLIQWVANGDASCLGTLFERHHKGLYNYCLQLTRQPSQSEDLVQELFLRLLKRAGTFRGESSFKSWAYHILRNMTFDQLRKAKRQRTQTDAEALIAESLVDARTAEQAAAGQQSLQLLASCLARLPIEQQEIIWLGRFEFPDYRSLAAALGCTAATARVRMHRAMQALGVGYDQINAGAADVGSN